MARSNHARLTGAERFDRRAHRRPVVSERRQATRSAVILNALQEV